MFSGWCRPQQFVVLQMHHQRKCNKGMWRVILPSVLFRDAGGETIAILDGAGEKEKDKKKMLRSVMQMNVGGWCGLTAGSQGVLFVCVCMQGLRFWVTEVEQRDNFWDLIFCVLLPVLMTDSCLCIFYCLIWEY
ncbi:unnamed protein product [Choristocarpus tenellus]